MRKVGKFGPEGAWTAPEGPRGDAPETAEASENAARSGPCRRRRSCAARLAWRGPAVGRAPSPRAIGPEAAFFSRSREPGRGVSERRVGVRWGGSALPCPAEFAGAAVAGTSAKFGQTSLSNPAAEAWGARHAQASEDRRRQAAAPGGPAPPAPVGADGGAAPAGAGAPSDPKRGPHGGVRDGVEDRKPEGAAPETEASGATPPARLPSVGRLSGRLAALAETAKAYARAAQADNTRRAYAADWRQFASWLRRQGLAETPPDPEAVGLYLAAQVERRGAELSVATLERRLSGIAWRYRQLGQPLEIRDRHIATVLAGIRRRHARPPLQKAAIFADELLAMLATLDMDLRGLRDRAILAIGFAGGLRRSEIVGLDCGPRQTEDGSGWIEIFPEGALLTIRGKTGWREVEIGRGSRADTCPVALLETWMRLGRIGHGPLFRAIARKSGGVSGGRLTDKHVVRLVQKCALAAGLRGDLTEGERRLAFGGHSLRAGLASSAQIEEAHVQKHLGHASAEMTRRYQRKRDRFTINLTKAAGL
jgi:integrase